MNFEGNGKASRTSLGVLAALAAALALAPAASAQQYEFNRADFATGLSARQVAIASFRGNGEMDLAVANEADNTVSILLGQPNGTFAAKVAFATGNGPYGVAVADFNGDGKLDLAVTNLFDNTVSVLLGNGDGTFTTASTPPVGAAPVSIAVGDFNGDGIPDLAVSNVAGDTVSILLGNNNGSGKGNGTFTLKATLAAGSNPRGIAVGDFNGDGKLDLAVGCSFADAVSIFLGNGDGTFTTGSTPTLAKGAFPYSVAVADFNRDGKLDLAVADNGSGLVSVLLGNGDGTFQTHLDNLVATNPTFVAAADVNGDGKPDLLVTNNGSNSVSVLLGNGDGTFKSHSDQTVGSFPFAVAVADVNGDGKLDLAVANNTSNTITVLLGNGDGTFPDVKNTGVGNGPEGVATGDFALTGAVDLAVANFTDNTVSILLGKGDGTFTPAAGSPLLVGTGTGPVGVIVADFNNDGKPDIATVNMTSSTVSIFLGNGDGTFQSPMSFASGTSPEAVATADFNNDGKPDLAVANNAANTVSILLGNGDGTFQTHKDFATNTGPAALAVADFNGDGKKDLAVACFASNAVSILLGKGDGTFQAQTPFTTGFEPDGVAVSDFNGDGKLDLATANMGGSSVSILLGNGDGTFQKHADFPAGAATSIAVGDFNLDGKQDVVVANSSGTASLLLGNGNGTLQSHLDYMLALKGTGVVAADFNLDGNLDFAAANGSSASVSVYLNKPIASLSPSSFSFGSVNLGSSSAPQTLTISNPSGASLTISSMTLAGDYSQVTTCGATLAPSTSCTDTLTFTPTTSGTRSGTDTITDTAVSSPQIATLTGTGVGPVVTLSPASLTFGTVVIGSSSTPQNVTLTNAGNATLSVTSIAISPSTNYSQTNTCGTSVAAGGSCTISVTFTPTTAGTLTATVSITDSAFNSPQTVSLTGTGQNPGPAVTLSPTSLSFGSINVGSSSSPMTDTLTNTGNATLSITSITTTQDYSQTNTCGTSVNAGASCTITVTFTPTVEGTDNGTLTITDNASNSPQTVSLTGTGLEPIVSLSPTSLNFGNQVVNTRSPAMIVTLTNTGNATLTSVKVSKSGSSFMGSTTCGTTVNAGAKCTISVTFDPISIGPQTGTVNISDNAPGSPQTVPLTGTGVAAVTLSPTSLTFPNTAVGSSSASQNVTLTNNQTSALSITSITVGTNYSETNTCGASVAASGTCTISVTFTPTTIGTLTGTLSVNDNASGSPQTVSLAGTGVAAVTLSPTSLTFGSTAVGSSSAPQNVTLTNNQTSALGITSITASTNYSETNTCGSSVAAGASCTISVTFTPTTTGTLTGTVSVTDNASGSPQTVSLTGTGVAAVTFSPASVGFGNVMVGTSSAPQNVTLTNNQTSPLSITSITASAQFSQTNTCGSSVAAGGSCTITVTFTPTQEGVVSGTLSVTDNASGSPQTVGLSGTGLQPLVSLSPTSLNFGDDLIGNLSAAMTVTLTNTGNTTLSITSVTVSGPYKVASLCGTTVNAGASCSINVNFKPTMMGVQTGTLSVTDNAPGSPQTVSLTGKGTVVQLVPSSLTFGPQTVGTTSPAQTVTLTDKGSKALTITSITITGTNAGDFADTSTCPISPFSLGAGASCMITVTFTPTATGSRSAMVCVVDNDGGSPQMVPLSGTGQ